MNKICVLSVLIISLSSVLVACGEKTADSSKTNENSTQSDIITESQEERQKLQESITNANALLANSGADPEYKGKYLSGYTFADESDEYDEEYSEGPVDSNSNIENSNEQKESETEEIANSTTDSKTEETSNPSQAPMIPSNTGKYTQVTVKQLFSDLHENAMRAENNWNNKYVVMSGYLSNIDNDGNYFSIKGSNDSLDFDSVQCFTKRNDDANNIILNQNIGDEVVVYGQIDSIGEVMGYSVTVDKVEGNATTKNQSSASSKTTNGKYTVVSVGDLRSDLENNAMRAEKDWKDQYVQVTGYLKNIDSDGSYFNIANSPEDILGTINCNMRKNESVKTAIMNKNIGDKITVSGKITTVGEVLGISIDAESVD